MFTEDLMYTKHCIFRHWLEFGEHLVNKTHIQLKTQGEDNSVNNQDAGVG